ncbi:MAG: aldo/keto reductase [Acholeplasmatales bacterium]|nr:aldo/keto reductase [Acholeplasmatales bacterium]
MKDFKLNNGVMMPNVGIGTFLLEPNDAYNSVLNALKLGYRMIDTANMYVNERAVGRAMKDSGIKREDIFLSTKLWPTEYENPNAVEETLERLGTDYIDLLFIHQPTKKWRDGYKQLIKAYKEGKIKAIGISNFEKQIEDVLNEFDVKPQVIQVECHPLFPQDELRKITEKEDIRIMAWFPLGGKGMTGELLNSDIVSNLAKKYSKSPAQIVLKWHTQFGNIVIPGSKNVDHIKDNIDIYDFMLTDDDMNEMAKLNKHERRYTQDDEKLDMYQNMKPQYEEK